jgi:hypothetical protein
MSATPDPAELAPSRDPAAYGRRGLFAPSLAIWLIVCVICIVVGVAVGRFGLKISPAPVAEPAAAPATPRQVGAAPAPPVIQGASASEAGGAPPQLSDRVSRLESALGRADQSAAAALAAATLSDAAQSSGPFDADLVPFQRLMPASADLRALGPLAAQGAASRADLAAELPPLASMASAAAHAPGKDGGLLSHVAAFVGRVVIVRRIDPNASGVDGVLARAESQAGAGDLEGALSTLDRLSPQARAPLATWMASAQRRIEIDRHVANLRAQALAGLSQPAGAAS